LPGVTAGIGSYAVHITPFPTTVRTQAIATSSKTTFISFGWKNALTLARVIVPSSWGWGGSIWCIPAAFAAFRALTPNSH